MSILILLRQDSFPSAFFVFNRFYLRLFQCALSHFETILLGSLLKASCLHYQSYSFPRLHPQNLFPNSCRPSHISLLNSAQTFQTLVHRPPTFFAPTLERPNFPDFFARWTLFTINTWYQATHLHWWLPLLVHTSWCRFRPSYWKHFEVSHNDRGSSLHQLLWKSQRYYWERQWLLQLVPVLYRVVRSVFVRRVPLAIEQWRHWWKGPWNVLVRF